MKKLLAPKDAEYFAISEDKRVIYYRVLSSKWFYLTQENFNNGVTVYTLCINKPSLTLMKID